MVTAASHRRRRSRHEGPQTPLALEQRIDTMPLSTGALSFSPFSLSLSLYSFLRFCRFYEAKVIYTARFTAAFPLPCSCCLGLVHRPSINAMIEGFTLLELDLPQSRAMHLLCWHSYQPSTGIAQNDLAKRQVKVLINTNGERYTKVNRGLMPAIEKGILATFYI